MWTLLQEYFEAVQVVVRDTGATVRTYLHDPNSGIWIAYFKGELAGCIALRPLNARAAEVKRLYVRDRFRSQGVAAHLLQALETQAMTLGVRVLYLDTKDDLLQAIQFYKRAGYIPCERYNDNPQATLFMNKHLGSQVEVRAFAPGDEIAFRLLNEAWISKLFKLEEKDYKVLREPQKYILSQGGKIYMACRNHEAIGCCALLNLNNGSYEVSKMGVAESERGQGVGRTLLQHVIADARISGFRRLYLETNHALQNAIHLYESLGFSYLKPEDVAPSPYARSDIFMELILT